jgi:hypothetical protein
MPCGKILSSSVSLQEQGLPHAEMADHLPCTVQPAPTVAFAVQTEASKVEIYPKESADPAASWKLEALLAAHAQLE